jgi:hypothetical protein
MDNPRINKYGTKEWLDASGLFHRDDGPAIEWPDGEKHWFQHGALHRDYGPAIEYADGVKTWYRHGLVHRDDGPAFENANGNKYWYLNDQELTFNNWLDKVDISDENKVMMKLKYG